MSLASCIESYILAKDGNRPHLLTRAFDPEATVSLDVQTDQIAFPDQLANREAIALALITQFSSTYENVYTFCVAEPPAADRQAFSCTWLVAMTAKQDQTVRIGWGQYDWVRNPESRLLTTLAITITEMVALPAQSSAPVFEWVSTVPYPWCSLSQLWSEAPALDALASWRRRMT